MPRPSPCMQCRPPLVVEGGESFSDMVVGGGVCNRPDELALKEVELPGSSRSDPPGGRLLCRATHRSARTGGGALGGAARVQGCGGSQGLQYACGSKLTSPREEVRLDRFALANVTGLWFALFFLSQPAPQGTVGAPFQRATPTRRAPPGAVGTLPPPPGRPVVPGLLWAHYTCC